MNENAWIETLEVDGTLRSVWDRAAGVSLLGPVDTPTPLWERTLVTSPFVDGDAETHSSMRALQYVTALEVTAATRGQCEAIVQALIADVCATRRLQLRVVLDGITTTWRATRPDIDAPGGDAHPRRDVQLTWPVQPHPTIEGAN